MRKNLSIIFWGSIITGILLAGISTQLPITFSGATQIAGYFFLATAIMQAVLQLGSAMLFAVGLKEFKAELKRAYAIIVLGIIVLGLARLQMPAFQAFNLWNHPWVDYGFIELVTAIAQLLIFVGLVSFASLLKVVSKLTSWLMNTAILLVFVGLVIFVPHSQEVVVGGSEISFDLFSAFCVVEIFFAMLSTALVLKIKQNSSPAYANALAWLSLALIANTIAVVQVLVFHFIGFDNFYVTSGLLLLPYLISGFLFLKAGKAFNTISNY